LFCADHCSAMNNIIKNTDSWGIDSNNSYTNIIGNTLENCGDSNSPSVGDGGGITIAGGVSAPSPLKMVRINGNTITGNKGLSGIVVSCVGATIVSDVEINNNQIYNMGQDGIGTGAFDGGLISDVRCQNNTIKNFARQAIAMVTVSRLSILGNQISGYGGTTAYTPIIWLRDTHHFDLSNNVVLGNNTYSEGFNLGNGSGVASSYGVVSNNYIHNCLYGGVFWSAYGTDISITGNRFTDCKYTLVYGSSLTSNVNIVTKDNFGYNPVGYMSGISVPGSTVAMQNVFGVDCMVTISGGTVSAISVGKTEGTLQSTGLTSGMVMVPAGGWIALTYSSAPTWYWFGN